MNLRSIYSVVFRSGPVAVVHLGPLYAGIRFRDGWRFRLHAPIKSGLGIRFCGVLVDYFRWSFWIYVPALRVDPPPPKPRSIYRIPKGKR